MVEKVPLRRSQRTRCQEIIDYYMVYLQEHEFDVNNNLDLNSFSKAISSVNSSYWKHAMEDDINSMYNNNV